MRSIGCAGSLSGHVSTGSEEIRMKMNLRLGTKTVCLTHSGVAKHTGPRFLKL